MNSTFDKRKMGLDKNVWVVMMLVSFLSLGLLGYTYVNSSEPCTPPEITINALPTKKETIHFVNEPLTLKVALAAGKKITWDFGDKSDPEEGFIATHTYKKEGRFNITAQVNGRCENIAKVNVKKLIAVHQDLTNISISESIKGNDFPVIGKEEAYSYASPASSYEWSVKNSTNFSIQKTPTATFKFLVPGSYTIQLILDNDASKKGFKEITVIGPTKPKTAGEAGAAGLEKRPLSKLVPDLPPLPEYKPKPKVAEKPVETKVDKPAEKPAEEKAEPKEEAPARKIIGIRNELFQSMLEAVITGQKDVSDFDRYLHNGGDTKVRENGGKMYKSFAQFCNEIKGKKITITSVELKRDENNVIQQIGIEYKRKRGGLFSRD